MIILTRNKEHIVHHQRNVVIQEAVVYSENYPEMCNSYWLRNG